jgi:hypothetical protein
MFQSLLNAYSLLNGWKKYLKDISQDAKAFKLLKTHCCFYKVNNALLALKVDWKKKH